jgi:hypothetical protein
MKMKNFIFSLATILVGFLNINNSYSQNIFEPGYIVDHNNDTIKGLIKSLKSNKTPRIITFKTISDVKETVYTPNDIMAFSLAGERYISAIVTIDDSPFRENELSESDMPQFRTANVFLQILIDESKSLYYLKDENLKEHFFIRQEGVYEPLIIIKYLKNVDGVFHIQLNEKFKGQLILYFRDCPSIQKRIYNVSYNKSSLIDLFKEYYRITQNKNLYQTDSEKIKFDFGFLGGLSQTKVKFYGSDDYNSLINADYNVSNNITYGGFFNIIFPQKRERWSFNNELVFTSFKVNGFYLQYFQDVNIYTESYSSIGSSFITLNNLLKYKYAIKKVVLFIEGGISNGFPVSTINHMKEVEHIYSKTNISETKAIKNIRSFDTGYILGLGSGIKHCSCEFRIERSNGLSSSTSLTTPIMRYFLVLGYKF